MRVADLTEERESNQATQELRRAAAVLGIELLPAKALGITIPYSVLRL